MDESVIVAFKNVYLQNLALFRVFIHVHYQISMCTLQIRGERGRRGVHFGTKLGNDE